MKETHKKILEAIKSFYDENGYCPSVREIGDMVGLLSTSSVQSNLNKMEAQGLIIRGEFSSPRSIRIPGFNYEKAKNETEKGGSDNEKGNSETVYVLHGFWITGNDTGAGVYGVSEDLRLLQKRMKQEAKKCLETAKQIACGFIVNSIKEGAMEYEIEGDYGDKIKLYITEQEVLKSRRTAEEGKWI
nr:MAG TPA: LexA repressor [Caudoviricetes sp.]